MIFETKDLTLLKVEHKSFTGRDSKLVEYDAATLLDDDGNKFEMPVSADAVAAVKDLEKAQGVASVELFVGKTDGGKAANKLRLKHFRVTPAK